MPHFRIVSDGAIIEADGRVAWVNDARGFCVARFSAKGGEVFGPGGPTAGAGFEFLPPTGDGDFDWENFRRAVLSRHRVKVSHRFKPVADGATATDEFVFSVLCSDVAGIVDPFSYPIWGDWTLSHAQVTSALSNGHLLPAPFDANAVMWPRGSHVARVAHLVANPDPTPIQVEIHSPAGGGVLIDGNHRLAAALYCGDERLDAEIGGLVAAFAARFPDRRPPASRSPADDTPAFAPGA
jgi:hypothetical protein